MKNKLLAYITSQCNNRYLSVACSVVINLCSLLAGLSILPLISAGARPYTILNRFTSSPVTGQLIIVPLRRAKLRSSVEGNASDLCSTGTHSTPNTNYTSVFGGIISDK